MHQTVTRRLGYAFAGFIFILALAVIMSFTTVVAGAQSATSTTGTTTTSYVFDASLSGANQVPPVSATTSTSTNGMGTTTATTTGHARVWFDMTNATGSSATTTTMWQSLHVWNGDNVTMAHLHCGVPGQNGPVVLDMFHNASSTDVNGALVATSSVSASNLHATTTGCSMPITNLTQLGNAMKAGIIYANVHSVAHPSGVVRGQMTLTSSSSTSTNTTTPPVGTTTPPIGTTTPPVIPEFPGFPGFPGAGSGLGSSINALISNLFGHVHHILSTFLPRVTEMGLRAERTAR